MEAGTAAGAEAGVTPSSGREQTLAHSWLPRGFTLVEEAEAEAAAVNSYGETTSSPSRAQSNCSLASDATEAAHREVAHGEVSHDGLSHGEASHSEVANVEAAAHRTQSLRSKLEARRRRIVQGSKEASIPGPWPAEARRRRLVHGVRSHSAIEPGQAIATAAAAETIATVTTVAHTAIGREGHAEAVTGAAVGMQGARRLYLMQRSLSNIGRHRQASDPEREVGGPGASHADAPGVATRVLTPLRTLAAVRAIERSTRGRSRAASVAGIPRQ